MDSNKIYIYCRLCAGRKPISELQNLQTDRQMYQSILEKLNRVNAKIGFDNLHPKMICFMCIASLDSAYDFVMGVENAQKVLSDTVLLENMEKEDVSGSDSEVVQIEFRDTDLRIDSPDYTGGENVYLMVKDDISNELYNDHQYIADNLQHKTVQIIKGSAEYESKKVNKVTQKPKSTNVKKSTNQLEKLTKLTENFEKGKSPLFGKLTWDEYSWTCSICETVFVNSEKLIKHSMEKHNRCNAFCCTICRIRRNCLNSMVNHVYTHDRSLVLSCFKCGKTFDTTGKMKAHRKKHIYTNYYCIYCSTSFEDKYHLNKHKEMYSTGGTEKSVENESLMCDICGKTFPQLRNLEMHQRLHSDVRHECKICQKTFKSICYLQNHVSIHDNVRPYICDYCNKKFRLKTLLAKHMIIHMDDYPHQCNLCDKSFRHKNRLKIHIMHHSGIYPYSCKVCKSNFINRSSYFNHMFKKHKTDIRKQKPEQSNWD